MSCIIIMHPRQEPMLWDTPDVLSGDNDFRTLQTIIGGYIEVVRPDFFPSWALLLCDEDGKLKGLPANFGFSIHNRYDMICGTFIVCAEKENEDGEKELAGLTDEQAEKMLRLLGALSIMSKVGSPLMVKTESEGKYNV